MLFKTIVTMCPATTTTDRALKLMRNQHLQIIQKSVTFLQNLDDEKISASKCFDWCMQNKHLPVAKKVLQLWLMPVESETNDFRAHYSRYRRMFIDDPELQKVSPWNPCCPNVHVSYLVSKYKFLIEASEGVFSLLPKGWLPYTVFCENHNNDKDSMIFINSRDDNLISTRQETLDELFSEDKYEDGVTGLEFEKMVAEFLLSNKHLIKLSTFNHEYIAEHGLVHKITPAQFLKRMLRDRFVWAPFVLFVIAKRHNLSKAVYANCTYSGESVVLQRTV